MLQNKYTSKKVQEDSLTRTCFLADEDIGQNEGWVGSHLFLSLGLFTSLLLLSLSPLQGLPFFTDQSLRENNAVSNLPHTRIVENVNNW